MYKIKHSDNKFDAYTFSVADMIDAVESHNRIVDAILFLRSYSNSANIHDFQKTIENRDIELVHLQLPLNQLVSCMGRVNDQHIENGRGTLEHLGTAGSIKLFNAISDYQDFYRTTMYKICTLNWAFQTEVIFAFHKLYSEFRKMCKSNRKNPEFKRASSELSNYIKSVFDLIGAPDNEILNNDTLTINQVIAIREKLSTKDTPIYPLHVYRDIMRFEQLREDVNNQKQIRRASKYHEHTQHEMDTQFDKHVELIQDNEYLTKRIDELTRDKEALLSEKSKLQAQNDKMASQIANVRRTMVGNWLFKLAQKTK